MNGLGKNADLISRVRNGRSKRTQEWHITVYVPMYRFKKGTNRVNFQEVTETFQRFLTDMKGLGCVVTSELGDEN